MEIKCFMHAMFDVLSFEMLELQRRPNQYKRMAYLSIKMSSAGKSAIAKASCVKRVPTVLASYPEVDLFAAIVDISKRHASRQLRAMSGYACSG